VPKLCANTFREYAEIETPTEAADGFGGYTTTWANKTFIWCMVDEKAGSEGLTNGRLETGISVELTTQYRNDITTADRVILDSITYNISRVENVDRRGRFLKIYAESGVTT